MADLDLDDLYDSDDGMSAEARRLRRNGRPVRRRVRRVWRVPMAPPRAPARPRRRRRPRVSIYAKRPDHMKRVVLSPEHRKSRTYEAAIKKHLREEAKFAAEEARRRGVRVPRLLLKKMSRKYTNTPLGLVKRRESAKKNRSKLMGRLHRASSVLARNPAALRRLPEPLRNYIVKRYRRANVVLDSDEED